MTVEISLTTETTEPCPTEDEIKHWITQALSGFKTEASLAIRLVDENEMRQINLQYRNKDKTTNVLSFPCQLPEPLKQEQLGDILICAPVVIQEAQAQHIPVEHHWAHLVVHGTLHLLGYDHEQPDEAERMEALETQILNCLGYPDPYGVILLHD